MSVPTCTVHQYSTVLYCTLYTLLPPSWLSLCRSRSEGTCSPSQLELSLHSGFKCLTGVALTPPGLNTLKITNIQLGEIILNLSLMIEIYHKMYKYLLSWEMWSISVLLSLPRSQQSLASLTLWPEVREVQET